ncbi:MAG: dihydroorotate dehydrogenase electron transfer subunit, partial [Deltaproteobacteria bacterium]|nr:dihydroorotate dehydrogenase electron transfer subunit [Deltaproteobacteria bacterium]
GDELRVHGPLGNGYPAPSNPGGRLYLVAGGMGIASLAACLFPAKENSFDSADICLLYGAAAASQLVLLDELRALAGGRLRLETITDDGSSGRGGLVTGLLAEELRQYPESRVFACGPEAMLRAVASILKDTGVPGFLSLEKRMACGFGVCLGCVQKVFADSASAMPVYRKVCTQGPVFPAMEVDFNG